MELSDEQKLAYDKYLQGHNLFITGPGGSGKSAFIKMVYASNRSKVQVTAMTGCAAILLECKAKTLHSWAGIGLGKGTSEIFIEKIRKSFYLRNVWRSIDVLVVDEVSMLSLKLFNLLNEIGKGVRGNRRPFGGIQLIFSGDFYQLPPVGDKNDPESQQFCFESTEWNTVFPNQIELVKVFRQTDELYSSLLNQLRQGRITKTACDLLSAQVGKELDPNLLVEPTKLFPTKKKVDQINLSKMEGLTGEAKTYHLRCIGEVDKNVQYEHEFLASNLLCDKVITLKVGAQVMCIINITVEDELVICNGSQGIVTGFVNENPRVKYNNGVEMVMMRHVWESEKIQDVSVSQIPLILSWALTIHKSQGATLDTAEIDAGSGIFECGQTYVALSRVKSLEGLYLTSFDPKKILIKKKVKEFYESLVTVIKN